jgi:thiamine-phosphate pyrophosphorylase
MNRGLYRIIDANFNRAREAARVIEDYCRFVLNCEALSGRTKALRHELCAAIGRLEAGRLFAARDTIGDVGVGQRVENQLCRASLNDCLTAGCKRLTEALRVLAEAVQTVEPAIARAIEKLRYDAYTLEKDIFIFADTVGKFSRVGLYVIITSALPVEVFSLTEKCLEGGVDCLQLRAKNIPDDRLFAIAEEFVGFCKSAGVISIINDRPDIVAATGADGVHLGQNDMPIAKARLCQLKPLITGKSTHSLKQLRAGCDENPTYVALGPVFATGTKPGAAPVGLEYVAKAAEFLADKTVGHVAIGGIGLDNVDEVLKAGARAIAVCSAVTESPDPAAVCRSLKEKILDFKGK